MMDLVYILGTGSKWDDNEIKYSLRSMEKHLSGWEKVYVIGEQPRCNLSGITHIACKDFGRNREHNIAMKILRACDEPGISEDFLFCNDDHFLTHDAEAGSFPFYSNGTLDEKEKKKKGTYGESMRNSLKALKKRNLPTIHFDVHAPIIINKKRFKEAMAEFSVDWNVKNGMVVKSLYCNYLRIEPVMMTDCKVKKLLPVEQQVGELRQRAWFSIADAILSPQLTEVMEELFPERSRFERERICITTPSFSVHGGIRVIMEWANYFFRKGYDTYLFSLKGESCNWFSIDKGVKIVNEKFIKNCAPGFFDLMVITSPHTIQYEDWRGARKKMIFMQMCEHLFKPDDVVWRKQCERFYRSRWPMVYSAEWNYKMAVEQFGRKPHPKDLHAGNGVNFSDFPIVDTRRKTVLVEGWEAGNAAKDTDGVARTVAYRLKAEGYRIVAFGALPLVTMADVPDEYYLCPSTEKMNELYAGATILLKASKYDARALAPNEAMTKGLVTARAIIEGDDDLIDGENCLRCGYDQDALFKIAKTLLENDSLRKSFSENCLEYVKKYTPDYWMEKVTGTLDLGGEEGADGRGFNTMIVAVRYLEKEWDETLKCIEATGNPFMVVDRKPRGAGSLTEALNRGFAHAKDFKYCLFLTNVTFKRNLVTALEDAMEEAGDDCAAIQGVYESDHAFLKPAPHKGNFRQTPWIEFTGVLVRTDVFKDFPLDELMEYWGQDIDWSYRVREAGFTVGVCDGVKFGHSYIRNIVSGDCEEVTALRWMLRRKSEEPTRARLIEKYGQGAESHRGKFWTDFAKHYHRMGKAMAV